MWTLGRDKRSSRVVPGRSVEAVVRVLGVGPREMLITCSIPGKQMDSIVSPLKKDISMDLSCEKRGWVSKRSEAK